MRHLRDRLRLPDEVRARLDLDNLPASVAVAYRGRDLVEARVSVLELRTSADTVGMVGYAATFNSGYDVYGGPPWGWTEVIAPGAFTKALAEKDDVRLLVNHDGVALARTKSGTMTLAQDDVGLLVDVPAFDLANPTAQEIRSAMARGDLDQMSFAFEVLRQSWSPDYEQRTIEEVRLFDVALVTYPANDTTAAMLRSDEVAVTAPVTRSGLSLALARAQAEALALV
jgi:uncharacterized protein